MSFGEQMKEIWRNIPGFERYEASDLGRIRSAQSGQVLKPHYFKGKYASYNLYDSNKKAHCIRGYRAVYTAFIGPVPDGCELDHIDNNTKNDRLDNIQPLSRQANMAKSWEFRRSSARTA